MADRREPQVRAILARIENDFAPHVHARIVEAVEAELQRTPDTENLVVELPDSHGAKLFVRGFPETLGQRLRRGLSS